MTDEKVLMGDHDSKTNRVVALRRIDPDLGEVLIHPKVPEFPITLMHSHVLEALKPYKQLIDSLLKGACDFYVDDIKNLTYEKMCKVTREIYDTLNKMIELETSKEMKERWRRFRDLACLGLQADDAIRFRFQLLVHLVNINNLVLTEGDLFWLLNKPNFLLREKLKDAIGLVEKNNQETKT